MGLNLHLPIFAEMVPSTEIYAYEQIDFITGFIEEVVRITLKKTIKFSEKPLNKYLKQMSCELKIFLEIQFLTKTRRRVCPTRLQKLKIGNYAKYLINALYRKIRENGIYL